MRIVNVEMSNSKYPFSEGWIKMAITLTSATPMSATEIKALVTWGKPDDYEFGSITQSGKKLVVYTRHLSRSVAIPAQ